MANAIDIGLLLRFLPFLSQAKGHFLQAGREALLGIDKLLEVWVEQVVDKKPGPLQTLQPVAQSAKDFVELILKELPETKSEDFQELKKAVLDSILDVLKGEIVRTQAMEDSEKKRHKIEALGAVEKVILHERGIKKGAQTNEEEESTVIRTTKVTKIRNIQGR